MPGLRRGVPFRRSHELVGQAVKCSEKLGVNLGSLPLAEYQAISPDFGNDVFSVFDFEQSVERRAVFGGTARAAVQTQIEALNKTLAESQ